MSNFVRKFTDKELAEEIIGRLNELIASPSGCIKDDVEELIWARIDASDETCEHPTIVVTDSDKLGFLGLLNGIVETPKSINENEDLNSIAYIEAQFDVCGALECFNLNTSPRFNMCA